MKTVRRHLLLSVQLAPLHLPDFFLGVGRHSGCSRPHFIASDS